jgi:beta-glucosidase
MKFFKVLLKVLLYGLAGVLALIVISLGVLSVSLAIKNSRARSQMTEKSVIQADGHSFRDLNNNGRLDIYEDFRQDIESRIDDLLSQMTIEEKAGLLWHPPIGIGRRGQVLGRPSISSLSFSSTYDMLLARNINHFNLFAVPGTRQHAKWYNSLQKLAEQSRLGIPVTISSDPRHGIAGFLGGDFLKAGMSEWPAPVGLAATGDSLLVAEFGSIANLEYRALGIRTALHPVADLATEPRWARIAETFGEDAELSARLTAAYIYGFQGESIGPESVACMTKHWPGGGPQKDGWDAHFAYGAEQHYPGNNFDYHLVPFRAAIEAGTAMIMPYYGIPSGQTSEDVGMSYNREIIQGLLREEFGYDGIVCTDWTILTRTYWGMEDFTVRERIVKALDAGVDQFGGDMAVRELLDLIGEGVIAESRIDESARRILRVKFALGLFDDPYVDEALAAETVGRLDFAEKGKLAQRRSIVLLKNDLDILPLKRGLKIYIEGIDRETASRYATVVDSPDDADLAVLRLGTPSGKGLGTSFMDRLIERFFPQGDLDFKEPELSRILQIARQVPAIVCIHLSRPAVFPEIADSAAGILGEFGAHDDAVLDIVFGDFNPSAKLPFELPSSMEAVRTQFEDLPYDSANPLFPFGHGLSYGE